MGYAVSQSNTTQPLAFLLVLSSDHITGATGKSPVVTISKNGGAFASPAGAITEKGNGWYAVAANAADTNTLGPLILHATGTACDPSDEQFIVVDYNPTAFIPTATNPGQNAIQAQEIINDALMWIGAKDPLQDMSPQDMQYGLRQLNQILELWSLRSLTIPVTGREVFPLVANQGGPSNPYTIGSGGDFDTSRPTMLTNIGLLVTNTSQPFELVRWLYTDDAYSAIPQKELTSTYFAGLWYSPTYASGLGKIHLWPVPSDATTSLVLYRPIALQLFANLTSAYDLPPGASSALTAELARRLFIPYGRQWTGQMDAEANRIISTYERLNTKMVDLSMDAGLIGNGGVYNILSDGRSGRVN